MISGKILQIYKLITYAVVKTGNNRGKMGKIISKMVNIQKSKYGFEADDYEQVRNFYMKHVSTMLLRKREVEVLAKELDSKRENLRITLLTFFKSSLLRNNI